MKKVFAFTLVMLLSSFFLSVPAFAEQIETSAKMTGVVYGYLDEAASWSERYFANNPSVSLPRQGEFTDTVLRFEEFDGVVPGYRRLGLGVSEFIITAPDDSGFYGDIEFSFNWYSVLNSYNLADYTDSIWKGHGGAYRIYIYNADGSVIQEVTTEPVWYDVSQSVYPSYATSPGVHVSFTANIPEAQPILKIGIENMSSYFQLRWTAGNIAYNGVVSYFVPSAVFIANRNSAELEELREITNVIIEQNNLTNEFYGEIISKVDDLYTEVGNLADLQQEAIDQFDNWNIVSSVPGSVTDKTDQADDVLDELHQLEKPEPDQIVPELDPDTSEIAQILEPYFQNTLILNILMMTLGFGFVSYVLFGKKG